jgi:TPR repeat protein
MKTSLFLTMLCFSASLWGQIASDYRVTAEQGDADAQYKLGNCYYKGDGGVSKDYTEAAKWYRKAAEQGYADAQFWLGRCYHMGEGIPKDYAEAMEWYTKAAEQRHARAHYNIGIIYNESSDANHEEAMRWWQKAVELFRAAAEQGDADAQWRLGSCYHNGQGVSKDYAEAIKWYIKAAEQGYVDVQSRLGYCYYYGQGVKIDYKKAVYWYTKAAEQGNADAQRRLGVCYHDGKGVMRNYKKTVYWCTKAAEQGDVWAQYNLGICYYNGKGVKRNYETSIYWYKKATEQGNVDAQYNLGLCYYHGKVIAGDYEKAVSLWNKAAEKGHVESQYMLGFCYHQGEGVAQNYGKAIYWYNKAAEQGYKDAKTNLEIVTKIESELASCYNKIQALYDKPEFDRQEVIKLIEEYLDLASAGDENRGELLNILCGFYINNEDLVNLQRTTKDLRNYNALLTPPEWNDKIQKYENLIAQIKANNPFYTQIVGDWIAIDHIDPETRAPGFIITIQTDHDEFVSSSFVVKEESNAFKTLGYSDFKKKSLSVSQEFHLNAKTKTIRALSGSEKLNVGHTFLTDVTINFMADLRNNLKNAFSKLTRKSLSTISKEIAINTGVELLIGFLEESAVSKKEVEVWTFNLEQNTSGDLKGKLLSNKYTVRSDNPDQISESGFTFSMTLRKVEKMILASPNGEPIYLDGATRSDYYNSELFIINQQYKTNNKKKRAEIREYNEKMYNKIRQNI